ncbi:MAG: glycosyltransferase family 4 protein [Candidatus Zhuqueibacterota bacterium]
MKIYYVCYENLDAPAAGATHVLAVVGQLARLGHAVTLFAPFFENMPGDMPARFIRIKTRSRCFFSEHGYYLRLLWQLMKHAALDHPRLIYIREMGLNFAPYFIAHLFQIPTIVEINGMVTEELRQAGNPGWKLTIIELFRKFNLRCADRLIAVTPQLERRLRRSYAIPGQKMITIENGVDVRLFRPMDKIQARRKLNLPERGRILMYAGSFYPHHGVHGTLSIFSRIKSSEKDALLVLVGDGALRKSLMAYAVELGLASAVVWIGPVPQRDVAACISAADACLLLFDTNNGHVAGRSIKILEYMSCARPVIVSRAPELMQFVASHRCGIAVDAADPESASQAIVRLLHDERQQERLGTAGRQAVFARFQWAHTAQKIEQLCFAAVGNADQQSKHRMKTDRE